MSPLKFYAFGSPHLEQSGSDVHLGRRKALALLAYLAITGQPQTRESLLALLWPDHDPTSGRTNMRRDLSNLRRNLGGDYVFADRTQVSLNLETGLWVDVRHFRSLLATAQAHDHSGQRLCETCLKALTEAAEIHAGELMAGFSLPDAPGFDEWLFFEREGLRQELATVLQTLIHHHSHVGEYGVAISYGRRWLTADLLHEPAYREMMQLYAWSGQQAAALRLYEECARLLDEELGVVPEEETTALSEDIKGRRLALPGGREELGRERVEEKSTLHSVSLAPVPVAVAHNLPQRTTPFVGREAELAALDELIANPDVRLVTIVGLGGMGKTRLALAAAERQLESGRFPDGVYFVPLVAVADPARIASAVAEALGLRFYGSAPPEEQLQRLLRGQKLLLVLDNFEQLTSGAERLLPLLAATPDVKILVTSRERLNLAQEWNFDLSGLPYPSEDEDVEPLEELLRRYEGLQLFEQRAKQVAGEFVTTAENLPDIILISQLVAGMPLGLELAAAWKGLMSCREIAEELGRNLDFLESMMRDVPERHRSLRAVFRHSWARLTAEEQSVFRKLSVFRGGFTRNAAKHVAGASLAILAELIGNSLLRREPHDRYQIHDLLRQYAAEKLAEDPAEERETRDTHAAFFARFMRKREADLFGTRQVEALDEIASDKSNVRHAWRWLVSRLDHDKLSQMMESYYLFCEMRGQFMEGVAAFRQASERLRISDAEDTAPARQQTLGSLLVHLGALTGRIGDLDTATALMQEGIDLLRAAGSAAYMDLAEGLNLLGLWGYFVGHGPAAEQLLRESLELATAAGDGRMIGFALNMFGHVAEFQGRYREANDYFSDCFEILDEVGEQRLRAYALNNRGRAAYAMGAYDLAERLIQSALAARQQVNDQSAVAYSLLDLGKLARMRGRYDEAETYINESLSIAKRLGLLDTRARCYNALGALERVQGRFAEAEKAHRRSLDIYREIHARQALPNTLNGLAVTRLAKGEVDGVRQYLRESTQIAEELGNIGDQALTLALMGELAVAEGDADEATGHFRQALEITNETGAAPLALEILVSVAALYRAQSDRRLDRVVSRLALSSTHPRATQETRDKVERLLTEVQPELEQKLGKGAYQEAWERGKVLELKSAVAELLAEQNDRETAATG